MYRWIRNLHLILGLFVSVPLVIYGVSAVQMSHPKWLRSAATTSERELALPPAAFDNAPTLAAKLMADHALTGELEESEVTPDHIWLTIFRPGAVYQVNYVKLSGRTTINARLNGSVAMLNRLHHLAGVRHGMSAFNVWGWLLGLVSVALIVIGATGIYLWFKIHAERIPGLTLLVVSLGFSLTLIVLLRTA